jgi:hypothetical protein
MTNETQALFVKEEANLSYRFIELDPADADLARGLAARRGMTFQDFVSTVIHDELVRRTEAA